MDMPPTESGYEFPAAGVSAAWGICDLCCLLPSNCDCSLPDLANVLLNPQTGLFLIFFRKEQAPPPPPDLFRGGGGQNRLLCTVKFRVV